MQNRNSRVGTYMEPSSEIQDFRSPAQSVLRVVIKRFQSTPRPNELTDSKSGGLLGMLVHIHYGETCPLQQTWLSGKTQFSP